MTDLVEGNAGELPVRGHPGILHSDPQPGLVLHPDPVLQPDRRLRLREALVLQGAVQLHCGALADRDGLSLALFLRHGGIEHGQSLRVRHLPPPGPVLALTQLRVER